MSDRDQHESMAKDFPNRPTHPDFERLKEVVAWVEDAKMSGASPAEVYEKMLDLTSVAYMAVNRVGMDTPANKAVFSRKEVVIHAADEWTEGFLFGMKFQQLGGHQK
jgi:hypothetical protein